MLLLNPTNGLLNLLLRGLFGLARFSFNIYTVSGMILVEGLLDLPIAYLFLAPAMAFFDVALEESSRVCGAGTLLTLRRIVVPLLIPGTVSGWILMATMFVRELTLSVVLSRPGTEVLAVQILRFAEDGLWGRLSALGILMIFISSGLVVLAALVGNRLTRLQAEA